MKKTLTITGLLLLSLFLGAADADVVPLFESPIYNRTEGKPNVYEDHFDNHGSISKAVLIIQNGTPNGENRVSSAVILLNGEKIFGPNDFNQQVFQLEAAVDLIDNNTISVELGGGPGRYLTVVVINSPPIANAGPDQDVVVRDTVTLDGSGSTDVDSDDLTYHWAFDSRPPESASDLSYSTSATATFLADVPGRYEVRLMVNDGATDSAADTVVIFADFAPFSAREVKITAGDARAEGGLGTAVAISGEQAIAGTGSAYVYTREGSSWTEQVKLTAGDEEPGDHFGASLAISGDFALIGAYGDDADDGSGGQDTGSVYVFQHVDSAWAEQSKLTVSGAETGDHFGASVSMIEGYGIVGAPGEDVNGDNAGAAYIYLMENLTWTEQAKLTAADAAAGDHFGIAVSITDGYAFVGAAGDDDKGVDSGAAYIFTRDGSTWSEQAKLTAGAAAAGDRFGAAVAISGSYAIVGAAGDDDKGVDSGAAYIFERDGSTWTEQAKLTAADAAAGDRFGAAVSISGSYAIVGAAGNDERGDESGAVYIFKFDGSTWTEQGKINAADAAAGDHFGGAVAIDGANLFVGAAGDDGGGDGSGAAYIFTLESYHTANISADPHAIAPGGTSTLEWTCVNADAATLDNGIGEVPVNGLLTVSPAETTTYTLTAIGPYGTDTASVTIVVDQPLSITVIEPDGIDDTADTGFTIKWIDDDPDDNAIISLYYDTDNSGADGKLIVSNLREDPDGEGNDAYVWDTTALAYGDYYIYAVIDDGVNDPVVDYGDGAITVYHGLLTLPEFKLMASDIEEGDKFGYSVSISGDYAIVGAISDDDRGISSGAAYIFKHDGSSWTQQTKLTAGDAAVGDFFGNAVSINGNYAIVGAYYDDDDGSYSGSAYIFRRDGSNWIQQAKLTADDAGAGDEFGRSVSISGDYVIVGANFDDDGGRDSGSAYIFKREGTIWTQQAKLTAEDAAAIDLFGFSVSISDDYAIVGAWRNDDAGDESGSAYIFKREDSSWTQQAKLTAGDAAASSNFGHSVSISGDYVIVGASHDDGLGKDSGSAYIFKRDGSNWTQQAKLTASDAAEEDSFGFSVSISGDYAIVGSIGDSRYTGSAHIFKRSGTSWFQLASLTATDANSWARFGGSVSISGNSALVGSYSNNNLASSAGSAYIYALPVPDRVNISVGHATIQPGESTTLSWRADDATLVTIDNGIGEVSAIGSISVSPTETTTYTITAIGPWGTITDSVTVTVVFQPTVTINADPLILFSGDLSTLTWRSNNAETCVIEPGIGSVALNGSLQVRPTETITYTITATGPGGTAAGAVAVQAILPLEDVDYGFDADKHQGGGGLVGKTVRILNGNMVEMRSDLQFPSPNRLGLGLDAVYNNRYESLGSMGHGWTHTYEASLDPAFEIDGMTFLKVIDNTGSASYFRERVPGQYSGVFGEHSHVRAEAGGYVWYRLNGSNYAFSSSGRLVRMKDAVGNSLELAYDVGNRLNTVTDTASSRILTFHYNGDGLLDHISGPVTAAVSDGIWVTYGYDSGRNLTSVTYADGSGTNYAYTDPGDVHNLTEKRNKLNHLLKSWGYDTRDRATSNFSREGTGVSIAYATEDRVNVTDAYGKERQYHLARIAGRKRVISISTAHPGGPGGFPYSASTAVSWTYDDKLRPIEIETAAGTITQYLDYDVRGNPGTIISALGTSEERVVAYTYHPDMDEPLTRTEGSVLGSGVKETVWDYDDPGASGDTDKPNESPTRHLSRVIEKGYTKDTGAAVIPYEYISTYTYNAKGQVLSIDGPLPGSTDTNTFAYAPTTGVLLTMTRPLIGDTIYSDYDAAGQVGRTTDVNNLETGFAYDGRGRVTTVFHPDTSTNTIIYSLAGEIQTRIDEDNATTTYTYDDTYGRLWKITDQDGNVIEHVYDSQGNLIERAYSDATGTLSNRKRWDYQHPEMPGRLYTMTDHDDAFTRYDYEPNGNVSSVTDPEGHTTFYSHDAWNRLKEVRQPEPEPGAGIPITRFGYDGHGNPTSVEDANHAITTYQYDDMGRMVFTASPDSGTGTFAYDEAGRRLSKIDAKGINVRYAYDLLDRLQTVDFPDDPAISYTYDEGPNAMGRLTGVTDQSGSTGFEYDNRGRLVGKRSTVNGVAYLLSRSYTPGGRLNTITYPSGRTIDFVRTDCACRVDAIYSDYNGERVTLMENLTYLPFGGAKGMDTASGGSVSNVFDLAGRLLVANPGQQTERTYEYYPDGKLKAVTLSREKRKNRAYEYDALNRLTKVDDPYGAFRYRYQYDKVGNRLQKRTRSKTETYGYVPGTNKLRNVTGENPRVFTHDLNGNMTGMGDRILVYNQDNRLIRVAENFIILGEYVYNALGQRVIKEAGGVTTVFHYDFEGNIVGESDLGGTFKREYLYRGRNRLLLVDVASQAVYTYLNDRLGTPQAVTDAGGNAVWEATYRPFGEPRVHPMATLTNNFSFLGQYYDEETGLYYNWHRYYDPQTGRYLRADPIGLMGGINLYAYVQNNPINDSDPLGLFRFSTSDDELGEVVYIEVEEGFFRKLGYWLTYGPLSKCYWFPEKCQTGATCSPPAVTGGGIRG